MFSSRVILATLCATVAAAVTPPHSYVLPSGQVNGTSLIDWTVGQGDRAFDGPHVSVNNGSTYQW